MATISRLRVVEVVLFISMFPIGRLSTEAKILIVSVLFEAIT